MSGFRRLLVCVLLACLLAATLAGCNQKNTSGPSFAFERPEYLEFVCFAPLKPPKEKEYVALPAQCCRLYDPTSASVPVPTTAPPECQRVGNDEVGSPALHAVVTQSTRGEVASVDLSKGRVLDSDRQVPGYTFLDTGGLPAGVVVPFRLPRADEKKDPPARNPIQAGPAWTYVASAEQLQVRAIPTCRFRSGTTCGPDRLNDDSPDAGTTTSSYEDRTRVQLTAAPASIELGPGETGPEQALWVSLPDLGTLARIDLAEVPIRFVDYPKPDGTPGTADYAEPVDAFVLDKNTRLPKDPLYFRVPAAPDAQWLKPVPEDGTYLAVCGLGFEFQPAGRNLQPAPKVDASTAQPQPTELHFDHFDDKDDKRELLLVADRVLPVIHAFTVETNGTLTSLGGLPTGSPVRTFVLTPPVPVSAVDLAAVPLPPVSSPPVTVPTKRYLYASDADGLVMVFEFTAAGGGARPELKPLLTPAPGTRFSDRIELSVSSPVVALEVMDTREESDYVCGQDTRDTLVNQRDIARAELAAALPAEKAAKQAEVYKYEGRLAIYDTAAPDYLRGVFVVAAAASGAISIIDVYDQDASCRARHQCCINDTCTGTPTTEGTTDNLTIARSSGSQQAVSIRRHAVRRRASGGIEASTSLDALLADNACRPIAEPYQKLGKQPVCAPADPWTQLTQTWFTEYQKRLPNSQTTGAALHPARDVPDALELLLPVEFHACSTGVEVGDLVAVMGKANEEQRGPACPDPTTDTAILLEITQAFDDRLVVKPWPDYLLRNLVSADQVTQQLSHCYPDLIGVELRSKSFLVTSSLNVFLHRVITAPDGRCVVDEMKDPLLTARLRDVIDPIDPNLPCDPNVPNDPNCVTRQVFKNPYVEFTLADPNANTPTPDSREVAVSVLQGSTGLQVSSVVVSDGVSDALPASLRYEPGLGNLFVVDSAGQGLRRFTVRPFQHDGQTFR